MYDLISREHMKSLGATCIASRSKDGTLFPIVAIDELPPADLTREMPSNTLGALDCIDRQEAIKAVKFYETFCDPYPRVIEALEELPSVHPDKDLIHLQKEQAYMQGYEDGKKPRRGKWIDYSDEGYVECPFCHSATNCDGNKDELHYCFSCGAELRGEEK